MIIGLAGYARVGKNEAARGLEPLGWEVHAYADKLREALYELNPIVDGRMWISLRDVIDAHGWDGYKHTEFNDEIRRLIQTLGTDVGRKLIGENVWVNATLKEYWSACLWVVPDVRFPNELKAIEDLGGTVFRISKPGIGPLNDHPSETALDDYKLLDLSNDGSIDDLHTKIRYYSEYMV